MTASDVSPSSSSIGGWESEFLKKIQIEFSKNSFKFSQHMDRINAGIGSIGPDEELESELLAKLSLLEAESVQHKYEIEVLRSEIELISAERDRALEENRVILKEFRQEREALDSELHRLTGMVEERREQQTKSRLEDKYRRALVYIDALQGKLANKTLTPTKPSPRQRPAFR